MASEKTIGRLSLYRRLLDRLLVQGKSHVYSHQLAALAGGTAAQVRRDIMSVGYSGSPTRGYEIRELIRCIGNVLDDLHGAGAALVGVGNLGRAIMAYFSGRRPHLAIVAAFDKDVYKVNRVIHGCPVYSSDDLRQVIAEKKIRVGIITVPGNQAQEVADQLVSAGVSGILNFAPVPLRTPEHVYADDLDVTMSLEKVAFFARQKSLEKEAVKP